ncbi:alpha-1,2-mannosyltransferase ALG9 isoform X2 [Apis dorsata]|uniref:alpha-1,2-mannosyltransferase ALG9 isoform X2 n=1 Tax=Apis dorsata TaxID=7462 RepID=UPI001293D0D4|nr:alpha-1,2-mannosyltransferase ALG9 isoform X2 [Apis dorsata]
MAPNQRQRQLFISKKELKKLNGRRFSKPEESSDIGLIYPCVDTAFKLLLSARFCSAIWSHITDCDETYNYWEPSHYLLYGNGQQTWEYSPQYALRSYMYLLIHMVPAKLYHYLLEPNPVLVFYFVRCLLSVGCALSEVYFYKNVCREFGIHIGRLTLVFLILSSGMYIASAAFLPSSFSMYLSTIATAAWYGRQYELAIFATALSTLLGWPFAALLGLPIAIEMLLHKQEWNKFIKWVVISGTVVLIPMIWIDSMYYVWLIVPARPRDRLCLSYWYSLAPLYLWFLVFFSQPHKEERFLFPVYPMICMAGGIAVDTIQKLYFFIRTKISSLHIAYHYLQYTVYITCFAILICGLLGISRSLAIYKGYYAPMEVLIDTNKLGLEREISKDININFCIGKEWHRFPSSFFFPSNNWKLQYLRSEFKGQLPQPFLNHENATSIIQPYFNDMNKEEPTRYFNLDKCHFVLDLDNGIETILEPNYSQFNDNFTIIKSSKFLNSAKSHRFFRAFYIPFLSDKYCTYDSYNLLQNIKLKSIPLLSKEKNTKSI